MTANDIVKCTGTANTTVAKNRKIEYIIIHYTCSTSSTAGSAKNTALYFAKETTKASAEYIVDDSTVVQYSPDIRNRLCWAAGKNWVSAAQKKQGYGSLWGTVTNGNSISVEVCSTSKNNKVSNNPADFYFTQAVIDRTVELVKYLMQVYNIPVSRVVRHADVSKATCPAPFTSYCTNGEQAWKAFKARLTSNTVQSDFKATSNSIVQDASLSGTYIVTASDGLNLRSGAGADYPVVITIPKGTKCQCFGWHRNVWVAVQACGREGYVNSKFLTKL